MTSDLIDEGRELLRRGECRLRVDISNFIYSKYILKQNKNLKRTKRVCHLSCREKKTAEDRGWGEQKKSEFIFCPFLKP